MGGQHGNLSFLFIQACIAILILVGFESVTSMGEEAKDAKRDNRALVLLSLLIEVWCAICSNIRGRLFPQSRVSDYHGRGLRGAAGRYDETCRNLGCSGTLRLPTLLC